MARSDGRYHLQADDQLVYIHIPKTAGTSFTSLLREHMHPRYSLPVGFQVQLSSYTAEELNQHRLLAGHFKYHVMRNFVNNPVFLTFLRDPIDRALSEYRQIQNQPADHPNPVQNGVGLPLEEFVFDEKANSMIRDRQTYMLASPNSARTTADITHQERTFRRGWRAGEHHVTAEEAIAVLESIPYFGLTERFRDSQALLAYTFSWPPTLEEKRLNVGKHRPQNTALSEKVRQQIIDLNQEDIKLYNYATQLFEERYQTMLQTLLAENRLHGPHIQACQEHVDLDFANWIGAGWYPGEVDGQGSTFCWTGPAATSLVELPLCADRDYVLEFQVIDAIIPENIHSLRATINDHPVEFKMKSKETGYFFTGKVPKTVLQPGTLTQLRFHVAQTANPGDYRPGVVDNRRLGVAFRSLRVRPR